jgi:dipeptidyl aminopeptidase/acylaminoacyl peptidase
MLRAFVVSLVLVFSSAALADQDTHPFSIHDMLAMERISDHKVSPDGSTVVFTLRTTDLEANRGRTDLWLVSVEGKNLRRLTAHPDSDSSPVWSPDGNKIYFLSTRSGLSQVWCISTSGGEAAQITRQPLDVGTFILSPDGAFLAFSMEVYPDCKTIEESKTRQDEYAARKATGQIYNELFFRHWDTWKDGRRSHLFVTPVAGGKVIDVTRGMDTDVPTKPFGGSEEMTFTPDSRSIVFTARVDGKGEAWSTNADLFLVPISGSTPPKSITPKRPGWDSSPVFSPTGETLAYLSMERAGYEADKLRLIIREGVNGAEGIITREWDRSADGIAWSPDGGAIYTTAQNLGQRSLFEVPVANGRAKCIVEQGSCSNPQFAKGGRIVYGMNHLRGPAELYVVETSGGDPIQITHINDERLAKARMGEPEQFSFQGWNDETVYGYVVKPVDFDASKKYPVAFLIHGGPQGSFGNDFHYRWNPQAYAGAGYAAVMIDFHGSTGYGQEFCDSIRGDWGGKPLEDLKKGLAAALEKYKWMDGDRVGALGASYGGYMINWIAGNWPDGFKCLVSHDGNICERMAYFDTEELWFPEWDHHGTPWENPEGFEKHNPVNFVKNWKTPMLVIHGGQDFRVVDTQGMGTFTACQRRGIPSKFLYFPDENHWVLKPANSILWHETVIAWLDQWTKK